LLGELRSIFILVLADWWLVHGMTHAANAEMDFVRIFVVHFLSCSFAAAALLSVEETKKLLLVSISICLLHHCYQLDFARAGVRESLLHSKLLLGFFSVRAGSEALAFHHCKPMALYYQTGSGSGSSWCTFVVIHCLIRYASRSGLQGEVAQRQASKPLAGMHTCALVGKRAES
jgi:hypothetical protein